MTLAESAAQLVDGAPDWLKDRRRTGAELLVGHSMPSPKDELWRYVDLDFDLSEYRPVLQPGPPIEPGEYLNAIDARAASATMVDGHVTSTDAGGKLVVVEATQPAADPVRSRLASTLDPGRDVFSAAHAAFSPVGLVIRVPRNVVAPEPVVVDVQAVTAGHSGYPLITIDLEENSEASVIVVQRSADGLDAVHVPHVEAFVGAGARLRLTNAQTLGAGARSVASAAIKLGRDSSVRLGEVGLGADFSRLRLDVDLDGTGADFDGAGLYFGDRSQVHDYRVFITHRGPRSTSNLFLKGAVEDNAHAVWTGLVRIEQTARGARAFETNRNLVLSEGARVDSVPNLEILTDDLQCGHGSSSGPLDDEQLYYIMSRGMRRERAERLLVRGFFEEIIRSLPTSALAEPTRRAVYQKFVAAQEAGRVL